MSKILELVVAYESISGTLSELLGELRESRGIELAKTFDLSEQDIAEFLALSDRVDGVVARLGLKAIQSAERESYKERVKRVVDKLLPINKAVELAQIKHGSAQSTSTKTAKTSIGGGKRELPERQAKLLRQWLKAGQPMKEFFEVNADVLGDFSDYELRPFVEDDAGWVARINEG